MDKEKAVKTLASLLAKHSDSLIIKDDLYKKKLINGAEYFFQFSDPFVMHFGKFYLKIPDEGGQYYRWGFAGKDRTIRESHSVYKTLKDAIGGEECKDANYFFVDGS